jgi:hypothetical protein
MGKEFTDRHFALALELYLGHRRRHLTGQQAEYYTGWSARCSQAGLRPSALAARRRRGSCLSPNSARAFRFFVLPDAV